MAADPAAGGRILWLDVARTAALIGMAVFHTGYDLEAFGRLPPGTTTSGGWAVFARLIAGSFIALAGASLYLAHGRGIRWRPFGRRLAVILAAALLVTVGTYAVQGRYFVFFGILHSIALSSVLGLAFLRLPVVLTLTAAAAAAVLPSVARSAMFNAPWLLWTGLAERPVISVDFVPPFPWLAPFLAGLALSRIMERTGLWAQLRQFGPGPRGLRWLAWPGQHSLAIYLLHQPILIGIVAGLARLGVI